MTTPITTTPIKTPTEADTEAEAETRTFVCPRSGTDVQVSIPPRKSASEFCPQCDYPMFWALEVMAVTAKSKAGPAEQQPKPEPTETPHPVTKQRCSCGEFNAAMATYCNFCGTNLLGPGPSPLVAPLAIPLRPATTPRSQHGAEIVGKVLVFVVLAILLLVVLAQLFSVS